MNNKKQITIEILWGLPASGKSTYASSFNSHEAFVVDMDNIASKNKGFFLEALANDISYKIYFAGRKIILDGLVATNQAARSIMDMIIGKFSKDLDICFKIVWWEENREACLHNDKLRRSISSEITIKNHPYEKPDIDAFIKDYGMKQKNFIKMEIVRKSLFEAFATKFGTVEIDDGSKCLKSESWSLGGTSCSYTGDTFDVSPDPQPLGFKEFDELLTKICPNLTFMQYKNLYSTCCTTDSYESSDYYGGSVTYGYFKCDLKKLEEKLNELGFDLNAF